MATDAREPDMPGDDVTRVSILLEKQLVDGIDRASGRFGLTRSAFIRQACMKALQEVEDEPDWNELLESTKSPFYYDLNGLAKRLQYVGYISSKGLRAIRSKISDRVGPAEILQGLPSPYEQLLRKLGVTRKKVDDVIAKDGALSLKGGPE